MNCDFLIIIIIIIIIIIAIIIQWTRFVFYIIE